MNSRGAAEQTIILVKHGIEELPEHEQAVVHACAQRLRELLKDYSPYGHMAIMLVSAEMQIERLDEYEKRGIRQDT